MKLLFDCTELSYYNENSGHRAGVFYVALNLLREFQKMGIDIKLHCDFKRYYFMKEIPEFSSIPLLKENSIINKIFAKLLYLTQNCPLRIKYAIIILARFYDKYLYRIHPKNLNQLKEFDAYFSPFTPASKEIEKAPLKRFRMIHDVIPIIEKGYPKSPKDWHYKIYNTINSEDYYFTNSNFTKEDVLKYFPQVNKNNIVTTLLGANSNFEISKEKASLPPKYIFSLCTLGKRKNLIFAIENFFEFIKKNNIDDLYLVLGGGVWNKFEKELNKTLCKFDKSKIILTGYIEENELKKYYSNALCFVYPSLYEGFGLPVLEAMQCGCPVITSNVSSLPEVIGDCGITINPTDNNELISAFEKMYYDNEFRLKCSTKGLTHSKDFSWSRCATQILNFIETKI